jgi:hypothetical protein
VGRWLQDLQTASIVKIEIFPRKHPENLAGLAGGGHGDRSSRIEGENPPSRMETLIIPFIVRQ